MIPFYVYTYNLLTNNKFYGDFNFSSSINPGSNLLL